MSLGENIRSLRREKGWTQGDLSERTGIKINHLSRLEQGGGDPKESTIQKLVEAFGCTPTRLLAESFSSQEATQDDVRLEMLWERVNDLPHEAKEDLINVLHRFCVGWEIERAVAQTPRKQRDGFQPVPVPEQQPTPAQRPPEGPPSPR